MEDGVCELPSFLLKPVCVFFKLQSFHLGNLDEVQQGEYFQRL